MLRGAGFQPQPLHAVSARVGQDVRKHGARCAAPLVARGGAHGFDLAAFAIEFLQGAATHKLLAVPKRVETDLGFLQS